MAAPAAVAAKEELRGRKGRGRGRVETREESLFKKHVFNKLIVFKEIPIRPHFASINLKVSLHKQRGMFLNRFQPPLLSTISILPSFIVHIPIFKCNPPTSSKNLIFLRPSKEFVP